MDLRVDAIATFLMNPGMPSRSSLFVVASLLAVAIASGSDWNQWRGPNRDGVAPAFKAPTTWTAESLAKGWTVTVGEGHSSPLIAGDRVYIFARENDQEI